MVSEATANVVQVSVVFMNVQYMPAKSNIFIVILMIITARKV